jgi:pimeloyl-ACP methyl ester carboxylesterase
VAVVEAVAVMVAAAAVEAVAVVVTAVAVETAIVVASTEEAIINCLPATILTSPVLYRTFLLTHPLQSGVLNMIQPLSIEIPQRHLDDLKLRIANTRWADTINNSGWDYGTNGAYLKVLSDYWLNGFDWRKTEAEINSYPNFIANIKGYNIHFLHIKGKGEKSIPLIITHGWPGSFLEMIKLIEPLTADTKISFDLVIPSVIGFGFSGNSVREGCNSSVIADLWHQLMTELGYEKYAAQGGDIGAGISTWLSLKYPANIIGLHLNYIPGSYSAYLQPGEQLTEEVISFKKYAADWSAREGAYAFLHSTKPATVAPGLNDSPVGLCAWILEKFNGWSDNRGNIENIFTKDELLSNISLYWFTRTIYSSIFIYHENSKQPLKFQQNEFVKVPVAFAKFPKELPTPPRSYIEKGFNIQQWTQLPAGGHFAAAEQPLLLATDIKNFFSSII